MNKIFDLFKNNRKIFIYLLVFGFSFSVFLLFNRGTYSVSEEIDTVTIDCPETVKMQGTIECSVSINAVTVSAQGISAKYSVTEGMEFVSFTSGNFEIYTSDEDGFVLVNVEGFTGEVVVGIVTYKVPSTAEPYDELVVGLKDVSVGDGDDSVLTFDDVSSQIRVLSNINTLDSITLSNGKLNEEFDKDKNKYTASVDTDKIDLIVSVTDNNSVVTGDVGELDIHYGTNNFSIVVTSEDGTVNTYYLSIYREYVFTSDKYVYNEEIGYIYTGIENDTVTILSNIVLPDGLSKKIENNKLIISYEEELLKEIDLIIISSDSYDLSKDYIYLGLEELDISKITFVNCDDNLVGNKLQFKYNNKVIDEFSILSLDLGNLSEDDNVITLSDYVSYDNFVRNITLTGNLTYEILIGEELVDNGNISDGMVLKINYNEEEVDIYNISIYNLSFNDNLIIDENNSYVKYKKEESSVKDFLTNVNVVGNVKVFVIDTEGNEKGQDDTVVTGDILTVYVGSEKVNEYLVAVRGDANGDGKVSLTDLVQIRKHIVGWKNPNTGIIEKKTGIYLNAIDMNNDGMISLVDLVRIRKVIVGIDIDE